MNGWGGRHPYGDYCPGSKWGWYGERKTVKNQGEARKILEEYYANQDVIIGEIKERKWFFKVEIKDRNNTLTDIVIIDKRTGRIRSIY